MALMARSGREWAPGGALHPILLSTLHDLKRDGIKPDFFFWQQGETEALDPSNSGESYGRNLLAICAAVRAVHPDIKIMISNSTYWESVATNEQVRLAVESVTNGGNVLKGPDLDKLGSAYRWDGVHFNEAGLSAAAEAWQRHLYSSLQLDSP
jgi:hypothetical protein